MAPPAAAQGRPPRPFAAPAGLAGGQPVILNVDGGGDSLTAAAAAAAEGGVDIPYIKWIFFALLALLTLAALINAFSAASPGEAPHALSGLRAEPSADHLFLPVECTFDHQTLRGHLRSLSLRRATMMAPASPPKGARVVVHFDADAARRGAVADEEAVVTRASRIGRTGWFLVRLKFPPAARDHTALARFVAGLGSSGRPLGAQ